MKEINICLSFEEVFQQLYKVETELAGTKYAYMCPIISDALILLSIQDKECTALQARIDYEEKTHEF